MTTTQASATQYEVHPSPSLNVSMNSEMSETLEHLSKELGMTKAETIIKAITLLKIAAKAKREGKAFGIAEDAGVLSDEIVGI